MNRENDKYIKIALDLSNTLRFYMHCTQRLFSIFHSVKVGDCLNAYVHHCVYLKDSPTCKTK